MLVNLIDRRSNAHDTLVDVVLEPAWHDNLIAGSTQHPRDMTLPTAQERCQVVLSEAIAWAQAQDGDFTLYLYTENAAHGSTRRDINTARG